MIKKFICGTSNLFFLLSRALVLSEGAKVSTKARYPKSQAAKRVNVVAKRKLSRSTLGRHVYFYLTWELYFSPLLLLLLFIPKLSAWSFISFNRFMDFLKKAYGTRFRRNRKVEWRIHGIFDLMNLGSAVSFKVLNLEDGNFEYVNKVYKTRWHSWVL